MSQPNATALPRTRMGTRTITTLAMLTGMAYVIMLISKLLPSVSGFLDFDFKDVIICMGGFTFGPAAAAIVAIVVATLELFTVSHTGIIGFIMNVLATCSFCCTASFVYKKHHTKQGAIMGLALGVVCLTAVMLLWNYLITPLYMVGVSRSDIAGMLIPIFLPFNLVKGGLNMAVTLMLYKPIITALRKANLIPQSAVNTPKGQGISLGFSLFTLALLATFVTLALVLMGIL